jgi:hypothetical protein
MVRSGCGATEKRLRCDLEAIVKRLHFDCKVTSRQSRQLQSDRKSIVNDDRGTAKRFREATGKRLRCDLEAIVQRSHCACKVIAKQS